MKKVIVTGTDGYIGSLLSDVLTGAGYAVTGIDTAFYKQGWLFHYAGRPYPSMTKDIRRIEPQDLEGAYAVVHMAELSNDPTGQLAPHITYAINHESSVRLATLAREAGVERFVYTSSCSVYGVASKEMVSEESSVNPQTAYAKCKTLVERDVTALASDGFSPVYLRNATAYGASPRMRFDIVVNNLCGLAATVGEIRMISDGSPWRPQVHVRDICQAIRCCLQAPREAIHNQIFNVGRSDENFTVREIAEIVADVFPGCGMSFGPPSSDNRSYRVDFEKISTRLPGFACAFGVRKGVEELHTMFERLGLDDAMFNARPFTRLKQLEYLLATKQIDTDFFWTY